MSIDSEHQEEENPLYPGGRPTWRFSLWDIAGVSTITVSGLFGTVAQGFHMLAREFFAAANYGRNRKDQREMQKAYEAHQRAAARELRSMVDLDADLGDQS